ncbi:hypothetical protein VUR80DRAFT_323 [Thermomyces stellatus]
MQENVNCRGGQGSQRSQLVRCLRNKCTALQLSDFVSASSSLGQNPRLEIAWTGSTEGPWVVGFAVRSAQGDWAAGLHGPDPWDLTPGSTPQPVSPSLRETGMEGMAYMGRPCTVRRNSHPSMCLPHPLRVVTRSAGARGWWCDTGRLGSEQHGACLGFCLLTAPFTGGELRNGSPAGGQRCR